MEIRTLKSKVIEFKKFLEKNLNAITLTNMSFDEYKSFVFDLFKKLDELKKSGVDKNEIKEFVSHLFSNTMQSDNLSVIFERRFSGITEEIIEFCSDPFFWNTNYDLYMQKWDKLFQIDWFKNI